MSKIVKGIVKGVKKIVKGVKKVFKKVASSTLGKVLLAGVAIYTGGVLFGAWGQTGPMSGMFGAWGGGAGAVAGSGEVASTVAAAAEPGALALSSIPQVGANVGFQAAAPTLGSSVATLNPAIMGGVVAPTVAAGGTGLAGYAQGALGFMKNNSLVTSMAFQGLASALSPDQTDLMRERESIRRERFESLSGVGDVSVGLRSSGMPLRSLSSGTPWHERLRRSGGG